MLCCAYNLLENKSLLALIWEAKHIAWRREKLRRGLRRGVGKKGWRKRETEHVYLHNIKSSSFCFHSISNGEVRLVYRINPEKRKKLLVDGRKSFSDHFCFSFRQSISTWNLKWRAVKALSFETSESENPWFCLSLMMIILEAL